MLKRYIMEDNEWIRRHGYQRPLDRFLWLQWSSILLIDICFFTFLVGFVSEQGLDQAIKSSNLADMFLQWPWTRSTTWSTMFVFSIATKALSIITSVLSTEDTYVTSQQVSRSKSFVRQFGLPVIDSSTGVCGICRVKVSKTTRHCKLCNKCVAGMDHHCKWLNCCVGERNYRFFFTFVIVSWLAMVWYSALAGHVVSLLIWRRDIFTNYVEQWFGAPDSSAFILSASGAAFVFTLAIIAMGSLLRLLCFHLRLVCLNMTTIEYLNHPSTQTCLVESSDDELIDEKFYPDGRSRRTRSSARWLPRKIAVLTRPVRWLVRRWRRWWRQGWDRTRRQDYHPLDSTTSWKNTTYPTSTRRTDNTTVPLTLSSSLPALRSADDDDDDDNDDFDTISDDDFDWNEKQRSKQHIHHRAGATHSHRGISKAARLLDLSADETEQIRRQITHPSSP